MLGQHRSKIILAPLVAFLFFVGCSASREAPATAPRQQPTVQAKEPESLAAYESTFRPSEYDEDVDAAEKRVPGEDAEPVIDPRTDSVSVKEQVVQGFRIQIFASAKIDEANLAKQQAAEVLTSDSLYIVYAPPVYKVRVGDYASRFDANRALISIIQQGYPDAWVVTDQIVKRTFTRIPRDEE